MKKFTTFYKMSLCALATIIFYGCATYNASSTSYVNGIYGRSERMAQKASSASAGTGAGSSSVQERNELHQLPDSLAEYLNDSTYVPAPDSYEMKLRQFDKEKYEKPVNVTVVNNYLNYNPWWYSYSYRWWDPFWDPFWDPYWDPWWPRPYISIHIGPYWHDPWWPGSWYHPYYPYNPWRPAIIVPVHVREARHVSRTSSSWGGGGISGGSRYGRATAGSTYIRGNSGTARRTNSSYSRNAYSNSNTRSYSANIRNDHNMDKERLYDYTHGNTGGTTSYRRTGSVGRSSGNTSGSTYTKGRSNSNSSTSTSSSSSSNYNSNNGSRQRSSTIYNNSNTYNNSGNSGGSQYRRTGGGGFSSPSHSGGGGYSAPRSSGGGGGGGRRR